MKVPYAVRRRCTQLGIAYGPTHASTDGDSTMCGLLTDQHWTLAEDAFSGEYDCPDCLARDDHPYLKSIAKGNQ